MRTMRKGFTLLELMAVVVIIGVLSIVAVVSYRKYQAKARLMEGYGYINQLRIKEEMYYASYSQYVSTGTSLTDYYPVWTKPTYTIPGTAWGIDCSNTGGDVHAEGFCALGFSPGNYTNWAFVAVGWYPGDSSTTACVSDTSKPWLVIRAMTAGTERSGEAQYTKDCYKLQATSDSSYIGDYHCAACGVLDCASSAPCP